MFLQCSQSHHSRYRISLHGHCYLSYQWGSQQLLSTATLYGQLVTVGGERGGSLVNSIHQLIDGQWVEIGSMSSGRSMCLVVTPSPDKMMIVGGYGAEFLLILDSVEECVVM